MRDRKARRRLDEFEAVAREHGGVPAFRGRGNLLDGVIVTAARIAPDLVGSPALVVLEIEDSRVLLRADDFDEMVEEGPPIGPFFVEPAEMLIGTTERLAEFEEFAYEIGGAVGFRARPGRTQFEPIVIRVVRKPEKGSVHLFLASERLLIRDDHFERLVEESRGE
jgi:hypothetical protein